MFGNKRPNIGYMITVHEKDLIYLSAMNTRKGETELLPTVFRSLKEAEKKAKELESTGEKLVIVKILIK